MTAQPVGTVVHAYGLLRAAGDLDLDLHLSTGIDGRPVDTVTIGGFSALVSTLDASRYGAAAWEAHVEDLAWVSELVTEHHLVLQQVVEHTDVLPLRLSTIHSDEAALRGALEEQRPALEAALQRVVGHVEMGIKVYAAKAADTPGPARPSSGREYLTRRSDESRDREEELSRQQQLALGVHEAFALQATHARANPAQDPTLSGREESMLLNGAYLVPREVVEEFRQYADHVQASLGRDGARLECTGPWPAYNFAEEEQIVGSAP